MRDLRLEDAIGIFTSDVPGAFHQEHLIAAGKVLAEHVAASMEETKTIVERNLTASKILASRFSGGGEVDIISMRTVYDPSDDQDQMLEVGVPEMSVGMVVRDAEIRRALRYKRSYRALILPV